MQTFAFFVVRFIGKDRYGEDAHSQRSSSYLSFLIRLSFLLGDQMFLDDSESLNSKSFFFISPIALR